MKRLDILRIVLAICALVGIAPRAAVAQMPDAPQRRLVRLGFGGGMSVPTSSTADALDTGINGQAFVLIDSGLLPPFRLNLGYQKFDYRQALTGSADGSTRILSGVGALSVDLFTLGPIRPYVLAGIGAFNIEDSFAGGSGAAAEESVTKFGIDGGAGVAFRLGRIDAFVEGRIQNIYTEAGAIDARSVRTIPVSFGILF